MRFLGKKLHWNFKGEVISDYKKRPEGIRVKHRLGANSVKMYDKYGRVLRIETTINNPSCFKVYRPLNGDPEGKCDWRVMRRGIADLHRRAEVSHASNKRYLDALSVIKTNEPIEKIITPVCKPVIWEGKRIRALRPWHREDLQLIKSINRGEFSINGFRNRDLRKLLFPNIKSQPEYKKRIMSMVTRKLRLLRAHGIIRKVNKTHRYVLTKKGCIISNSIIQSQNVTLEQLNKLPA
jgi:hypothetical protein